MRFRGYSDEAPETRKAPSERVRRGLLFSVKSALHPSLTQSVPAGQKTTLTPLDESVREHHVSGDEEGWGHDFFLTCRKLPRGIDYVNTFSRFARPAAMRKQDLAAVPLRPDPSARQKPTSLAVGVHP